MTYKRQSKPKPDMNKNPDKVDLSKGVEYIKQGKVKYFRNDTPRGDNKNNQR